MWEYKIAHYKKENERAIFREKEWVRWWLCYDNWWGKEREAKRYLHESDCISAFISIRKKWGIEDTSKQGKKGCEEKLEKTSWSEL